MPEELGEPPVKKIKTDLCEYVNTKKNKPCKSSKSTQSKQYCTNHILYYKKLEGRKKHNNFEKVDPLLGKRIPCPLDGGHSCWEKELSKHLDKCTKGKTQTMNDKEVWFQVDINKGELKYDENNESEAMIIKTINVIRELKFDAIEKQVLKDEVIQLERVTNLVGGQLKHASQQSSLVSHMKNVLLPVKQDENYTICEFGCGRAELSRYSALSLSKDSQAPNKIVLIDRGNNRLKFDKNIREESENTSVERYKCDIKDIKLAVMLKESADSKVLAISKHLCGAATDLTLRCLNNSPKMKHESAAVIAMCCRHLCNSQDYINPEFIRNILANSSRKEDLSFEQFFKCLSKICSYAICSTQSESSDEERNHFTKLSSSEREQLGFVARRVLDEGRIQWCRENWNEKSKLLQYSELNTTLENVVLVVPFA